MRETATRRPRGDPGPATIRAMVNRNSRKAPVQKPDEPNVTKADNDRKPAPPSQPETSKPAEIRFLSHVDDEW